MSFWIRQIGDIAHVRHLGTLTVEEIEEAVAVLTEHYAEAPLQGLLVDLTGVTDIADASEYLRWFEERGGITPVTKRTAFVARDAITDVAEFMASTIACSGHTAQTFESADEALVWLQA